MEASTRSSWIEENLADLVKSIELSLTSDWADLTGGVGLKPLALVLLGGGGGEGGEEGEYEAGGGGTGGGGRAGG